MRKKKSFFLHNLFEHKKYFLVNISNYILFQLYIFEFKLILQSIARIALGNIN